MNDESGPRCLVSHPAYPPHNLSIEVDPVIRLGCFTCGGKYTVRSQDYTQFHCTSCGVDFHFGCHERPRRITHPYHLQHPLTLFYRNLGTGIVSNIIPDFNPCEPESWFLESDTSDQGKQPQFVDIIPSRSDVVFDKCTWCGNDFKGSDWFYRCLVCSFCLDLPCAETIPPLAIPNPKSHHHSLLFLPRPLLVPCDACGSVDASVPSYACFQCNYMVHQDCIDLPRVIKITRHPHRLSYIPYRSPMKSLCRICYKDVDFKYGQYSCNREDCSYVVHSKCATHVNVWDGTDLEWETEDESVETEDSEPFKQLGDGFIQHFCHEHPLKHKNHDNVRDTEKQCEACVFPIVSQQFYHCEECNYSLHEVCAGLTRKLDHALHNHTLTLYPSSERCISCSACSRASTGFYYACSKEKCHTFALDVRCVSVVECFIHKSHEHPIFIATSYNNKDEILCKGCKKRCWGSHLQCTECEFALCYACGTIPNEIHYRFDKHPLTLSFGETADHVTYWCEVCEKRLDPTEWFYTCNDCCITLHLGCIFGSSYFMKPGSIFHQSGGKVKVIRNCSNTRLFCFECNQRCTGFVYYEGYWWMSKWDYNNFCPEGNVFCSYECKERGMKKPFFKHYR